MGKDYQHHYLPVYSDDTLLNKGTKDETQSDCSDGPSSLHISSPPRNISKALPYLFTLSGFVLGIIATIIISAIAGNPLQHLHRPSTSHKSPVPDCKHMPSNPHYSSITPFPPFLKGENHR